MIQCPECGKEIADDSAHCGFCGATIETGTGKKTMLGFAALSGDALEKAAEEAKSARQAAGGGEQTGAEQPASKLNIPKPGIPKPSAPPKPSSGGRGKGKFSLPEPSSVSEASEDTASAPPDAKTAVMPSVGDGADASSERPDPSTVAPGPGSTPYAGTGEGAPADVGTADFADTDPNGFETSQIGGEGEPPAQAPDPSAAQAPAGAQQADPDASWTSGPAAEETLPEVEHPHAGGGPTALEGPMAASGPSEFGSGTMQVPDNTLPQKKSKTPLIIGAVFGFLFLSCCVASVLYSIWPML